MPQKRDAGKDRGIAFLKHTHIHMEKNYVFFNKYLNGRNRLMGRL